MMSPLIDVTNIVVKDLNQANIEPCSIDSHTSINNELKSDSIWTSVSKNSCENKSEKINSENSSSKFNKHTHIWRKKQEKSVKQVQADSPVLLPNEQEVNNRVPPIECNDLFQSLETLTINEESKKTLILTEKNKLSEAIPKCSQCACVSTGFSNEAQPPSGNFSCTYKCIACGLELSSIENLTNHLIRHICEGLHAASWLNNAMLSLLSENPSNISVESSPQIQAQKPDVPNEDLAGITNSNSKKSESISQNTFDSQT